MNVNYIKLLGGVFTSSISLLLFYLLVLLTLYMLPGVSVNYSSVNKSLFTTPSFF